jgi:hypothetical protein
VVSRTLAPVTSLRKLWGLITVLCAAPAVPLGVLFWAVLPEQPGYGIVTLAIGLAITALGGLLMWLGRHPVPRPVASPSRTATTDLSGLPLILDGIADLLD